MLKPVIKTIEVPCAQKTAFKIFIEDLASWWPMDKNSVSAMQGEVAKTVTVELKTGGKVFETAYDGQRHHWATISQYDPYNEFTMDWHIGTTAENATLVIVKFITLTTSTTKVVLTHTKWEAFGEKAADMRNGYDQGWVGVFEHSYNAACNVNHAL